MRNSLVLFGFGPLSACGAFADVANPFEWSTAEGARRVTLRCDWDFHEGVDFATGEVATVESGAEVDLYCTKSRLIGLTTTIADGLDDPSADGFCLVRGYDGARFERLEDVTADCLLWSLQCSYLTNPYEPSCAGVGARVLDRDAQSEYVLRVVSDDTEKNEQVGVFVLEYAPAP